MGGKIVVTMVLSLLLLVGLSSSTLLKPCKEHYENKSLNFSVDYPSGWQTEEDKEHATVFFFSKEKDSLDMPVAKFYVHFVDWAAGMEQSEFEELLVNSYYNEYNQVRISYQEKDNPNKKNWGMVELFAQKGIEPIKYIRTYYDYTPDESIIISYQTLASQTEKYKVIIESSIKSFKNKRSTASLAGKALTPLKTP